MILKACLYVLLIFHYIFYVTSLNEEGFALLSFKQALEVTSTGSLDNWNSSDVNPCSWTGVQCGEDKVVSLSLPYKKLIGPLVLDLGKLFSLHHLNLRNNSFSGFLPVELFNSTALRTLILSGNLLSGSIPSEIGNLRNLQNLDFSQNSLNGSLPSSLLQCQKLKVLVLTQNSFSGPVPDGLGTSLVVLQKLDLSFNNFTGLVPSDLPNMKNLEGVINLSNNCFSGPIPSTLGNLPELVYINLSYNNLSGPIPQNEILLNAGPTAFVGNPLLCGPPLKGQCPPNGPKPIASIPAEKPGDGSGKGHGSKAGVIMAIVACVVSGICFMVLISSYLYKKVSAGNSKQIEGGRSEDKSVMRKDKFCFRTDDLESLSEQMEQSTFIKVDSSRVNYDLEQLLKASAFLLGKSGLGIVYKVVLANGEALAVRRLEDGGSQRFREFQAEVETIGKVKHPNIVSLLAYCWSNNEKLLIYEFVPNGDLATAIHGRTGMTFLKILSWSARLRISHGIAKALAFLHEFGPKRYVHGNLKPTNILLGENLEPQIADFGLNRFGYTSDEFLAVQLENTPTGTPQQCSPYMLTPTNPNTSNYYKAPEASKASKPSQKWDVYSFGVILLEMVSGKSPSMQISSSGMDIVRWIQLSMEVKPLSDVLDPFLKRDVAKEEELVSVLKIALACVNSTSGKRPSMSYVCDSLESLVLST